MRAVSALSAALAALVLLGACGQAEDMPGEQETPGAPDAPNPPDAEPEQEGAGIGGDQEVYVFNTYGDEEGRPEQEPGDLVASEFTTFNRMDWSEWGAAAASGRGEVSGTWCLPECGESPYAVGVELADPQEIGGTAYFTGYTVTDPGDMSEEMLSAMEGSDGGRLLVPARD